MSAPTRPPLSLACGLLAAGVALGAAAADGVAPPPNPAASAIAPAPVNIAPASKPSVSTRAPIRSVPVRNAPAPRPESSPAWAELTPPQQQALEPLAGTWRALSEAHKRKWLAVSQNYPTMPAGERARLHSRMAEWAALSPQQRTQARLNFAESQRLDPDDKRAKWEAYQSLPPEEKRKLAAGAAASKPPPTAVAEKPVPPQKLARLPKPKKPEGSTARIAVVPGQIDKQTLLPQPLPPVQP